MPKFFVIAFVGRTGSSYLEALLDSHPDAQCFGEVILPGAFADNSAAGIAAFLDKKIHTTDLKASGFKLPLGAIETPPGIFDVMTAKDYRVIHITRRDKLDQYLSMQLAIKNSAWRSDYGRYSTQRIRIDTKDMLRYIERFATLDRQIAEMTAAFPYLHVEYEDILANQAIPNVLDFLGLSRHPLTSKYERQRSLSQGESIENYDEVTIALANAGLISA